MKKIFLITIALIFGCATCTIKDSGETPPNVREQPGIEYCDDMCNLFLQKINEEGDEYCHLYYDDVTMEDGSVMNCVQFCEYELKNSVPLNPQCIVENITTCEELENICQ